MHLKTDFDGLPIAFHLAGGEVSDTTQLEISLDIGPDIAPRVAITDKGYDSAANRAACRRRGIIPVIRPVPESSRQAEALQANCHALRQNPRQLWRIRRLRLHPHLGQIRPQGLAVC
jgi:hypothetical protein